MKDFWIGDLVIVKGRDFVGEIVSIDFEARTAEVEWQEYDYMTSDNFSLDKIELLNIMRR